MIYESNFWLTCQILIFQHKNWTNIIEISPETTMLYTIDESTMVLIQLLPYLPMDRADQLMALFCHASYGNYDEYSGVETIIRQGAHRLGIQTLREGVFKSWRAMYRRADISKQLFIQSIQNEEKKIFGSNKLYEMKRAGRSSKKYVESHV